VIACGVLDSRTAPRQADGPRTCHHPLLFARQRDSWDYMPRHGNTISRSQRHHKSMNSAAHGKGHDAHLRKAKQEGGTKAKSTKPVREDKRERL
jgi:hypothetical protein